MKQGAQTIRFAGIELDRPRHICAFFNSDEEEYRTLLPFIKDGFECGHKAVHIVSPDRQNRHLRHLAAKGIDVGVAQRSGQLDLRTSTEVYLRDGQFDQQRMLETFERIACESGADGSYPLSRVVCHMDWAMRGTSYIDDLIEFEARVNNVWCQHDDAVICVYDLAKFGGDTVIDVMRTHPMIIVGGIIQRNPFFVNPEEFIEELQKRRAAIQQPLKSAI